MRPIRITRHARNRMRRHQISEDLVQEAVRAPDWEEASLTGRVNRWKVVAGRFLRITCREEPDRVVIISAVFKRKPPGRDNR